MGFLKNNNVCYNALILKVFVQRIGIGAPPDHKSNMYKKLGNIKKNMGGCRTTKSGKKTKKKGLSGFSYTFLV
jgi:hypothetical protein